MKTAEKLDEFTRAYIECALWSTNDESDERGGEPLDAGYTARDIAPDTLEKIISDCRRFQEENAADIAAGSLIENYSLGGEAYTQEKRAGHDFWLTRNHHGAGFWDGDWPEPAATRLTKAADAFGEVWLYMGDDGRIYC